MFVMPQASIRHAKMQNDRMPREILSFIFLPGIAWLSAPPRLCGDCFFFHRREAELPEFRGELK
jgi:hypothetical protein